MPQQTVHVLSSAYHDGTGNEVVRGYKNKARADEDLALVSTDSNKVWKLTEVPLVGGRARNSKKKVRRPADQQQS